MRRSGAGAKAPKRHSGARTDVADVPHFLPRPRPLPADSRREVGGAAPASPIPNPPPPPKLPPLLLPPPLNIDPPPPPNIEPPPPALPPNARGAVAPAPKPPNPPDAAAGAPPAGHAGQTQLSAAHWTCAPSYSSMRVLVQYRGFCSPVGSFAFPAAALGIRCRTGGRAGEGEGVTELRRGRKRRRRGCRTRPHAIHYTCARAEARPSQAGCHGAGI